MTIVQIIVSPDANRFVRLLISAIAFSIPALVAHAGPCDITWNGDKLAANSRGHPLTSGMRLLDQKNQYNNEVTVAQIMAFYEAKEAISRVVGRTPSFVICDGKEPNAFAMKGSDGDIVGITIGMMKLANGDRDMAAIVVGHEYGHHIKNHASEGEARDLLIGILGAVVGAVIENKTQQRTHIQGLGLNLGQIGATLVSSKFSRDQEREADELGFGYMVSAGFNPNGAIRLADQMNRVGEGNIGLFFDSHPGWDERNTRFRTMIANSSSAQQIIARTGNATTLLAAQNISGGQAQIALAPTYETSNAEKSYSDGLVAFRNKDVVTGVRHLRSAAEANYAPAQVAVGFLFLNGRGGLTKDDAEAVRLFRLAADQGDATGKANLGFLYESGRGGLAKDEKEAVRLYRLAADQGNALGQANLGAAYDNGKGGLPKDGNEAVRLYRLAADQGNAQAQANLGFMYANGKGGLSNDDVEAVRLFRLAADQGNALGQNNLGFMYQTGRGGLSKDDADAGRLYRLAAAQGNVQAQAALASWYTTGRGGLPKDDVEAARLFRLAADAGHGVAQVELGLMYATGRGGLFKDDVEAVRLFRLAADQGNAGGQNNLGFMYQTGRGGLYKDENEAVRLYRLAADQGFPTAIANLKKLGKY